MIIDLTGTTWVFDASPTSGYYDTVDYEINFTSYYEDRKTIVYDQPYTSLRIVSGPTIIYRIDSTTTFQALVWSPAASWAADEARTIIISGGTDAQNTDLIAFLEANATCTVDPRIWGKTLLVS